MLVRQVSRVGLSAIRIRPIARFGMFSYSTVAEKSPTLGSYHWNLERALSLATVPLLGSAFVYGSNPIIDTCLGIVLPFHCYLGVECMIQDYFPARRNKVLHTIFSWTLKIATGLVLYGCYVINTSDVGITGVVRRLWTGKLKSQ